MDFHFQKLISKNGHPLSHLELNHCFLFPPGHWFATLTTNKHLHEQEVRKMSKGKEMVRKNRFLRAKFWEITSDFSAKPFSVNRFPLFSMLSFRGDFFSWTSIQKMNYWHLKNGQGAVGGRVLRVNVPVAFCYKLTQEMESV